MTHTLWLVAFDEHVKEYVALRKEDWHEANHQKPLKTNIEESEAVGLAHAMNTDLVGPS